MNQWRRWTIRLGAVLLLACVFGVAGLGWWSGNELACPHRRTLQDYHIEWLEHAAEHGLTVHPFTAAQNTPALMCEPDAGGNLAKRGQIIRRQLEERGMMLAPAGQIVGTLVMCHGRAGRKEDILPIAERLCAAGLRCISFDLPGHGDNPEPLTRLRSVEKALPATVLADAERQFGFKATDCGLMGMSMGGAIAVNGAAVAPERWKALALISTFDEIQNVVRYQADRRVGSMLGAVWANLASVSYHIKSGAPLTDMQSMASAAAITLPTFDAHGNQDEIVPMALGRRLFDAFPAKEKRWVEIPDAGHGNVLVTPYPIYADLAEWMLRHLEPDFTTALQAAVP